MIYKGIRMDGVVFIAEFPNVYEQLKKDLD